VRVCTGNKHARRMFGGGISRLDGRRGGEVIECVHAREPGGCGGTLHCKSCTIRRTVLDTFATGRSFVRVPAYPDVQTESGVKTLNVWISTEKVGTFVLLQIENIVGEVSDAASADVVLSAPGSLTEASEG
jgi:hypothetical protein